MKKENSTGGGNVTTDIFGLSKPLTRLVRFFEKMYEPRYIRKMAKAKKEEKEILEKMR